MFGDERGGRDKAGNPELFEAASDAKAAGAGFLGDLQVGTDLCLAHSDECFF